MGNWRHSFDLSMTASISPWMPSNQFPCRWEQEGTNTCGGTSLGGERLQQDTLSPRGVIRQSEQEVEFAAATYRLRLSPVQVMTRLGRSVCSGQ